MWIVSCPTEERTALQFTRKRNTVQESGLDVKGWQYAPHRRNNRVEHVYGQLRLRQRIIAKRAKDLAKTPRNPDGRPSLQGFSRANLIGARHRCSAPLCTNKRHALDLGRPQVDDRSLVEPRRPPRCGTLPPFALLRRKPAGRALKYRGPPWYSLRGESSHPESHSATAPNRGLRISQSGATPSLSCNPGRNIPCRVAAPRGSWSGSDVIRADAVGSSLAVSGAVATTRSAFSREKPMDLTTLAGEVCELLPSGSIHEVIQLCELSRDIHQ